MTPFEFDRYLADQDRAVAGGRFVVGDGTLMLGYHIDRSTLHVYLEDGEIHAVTYVGGFDGIRFTNWVHGPSLAADELMPSKRAYPQHTNHRFACVMRELGHPLPFTSFDDTNAFGTFRGERVSR